jgi:protein-tyrosine phosphatase
MTATDDARTDMAGLVNLRDCGGLPTEDGGVTRHGVLYRSEAPLAGEPDPAIRLVGGWPPPTVIDLRSGVEVNGAVHALTALGATVHHVPMLEELTPEELAEHHSDVPGMYRLFVRRCGARLIEAFRIVVANAQGPVLVHCAAGKDRTGIVVAMLLRSAGVTKQAVVEDYLHSNTALEVVLRRLGLTDFDDRYRVRAEAIEQALEVMEYHPDGLHGWLTEHGLPPEELATWRERLVEPATT